MKFQFHSHLSLGQRKPTVGEKDVIVMETESIFYLWGFHGDWRFYENFYLEVDVSVLQSVGATLIQEVYVFYQQTKERDDNLQMRTKRRTFSLSVIMHTQTNVYRCLQAAERWGVWCAKSKRAV